MLVAMGAHDHPFTSRIKPGDKIPPPAKSLTPEQRRDKFLRDLRLTYSEPEPKVGLGGGRNATESEIRAAIRQSKERR